MKFNTNYYMPECSPGRLVVDTLAHLMWPWNLGLVDIFMETDFSTHGYRFIVTSSTLIDDKFVYIATPNTLLDERELAVEIGRRAAEYFLSLSEPIHDNIILGEN